MAVYFNTQLFIFCRYAVIILGLKGDPVNFVCLFVCVCIYHHISVMELGHLLTCSGLTYPEVSSKVYHDSFCQLRSSISISRHSIYMLYLASIVFQ